MTEKKQVEEMKKDPAQTKLKIRQQNEIERAGNDIKKAIADAEVALRIALKEITEKENSKQKLDEKEKSNIERTKRRELLKFAKYAVTQMEKNNKYHIFEFRSTTGDWWKIGGNSIAIHRMMVATYLDRNIKINLDRDDFYQFRRTGVICLKGEQLERDIAYAGAGLTLDEEIDYGPFDGLIRAYKLRVPVSLNELRRFEKLDEQASKSLQDCVFASAPEIDINNELSVALPLCFRLECNVDSNARGYIGHRLLDSMIGVRRAYYDVANSSRRNEAHYEAMRRMLVRIGDAMTILTIYSDLRVANMELLMQTSQEMAKLRELVAKKIAEHYGKNTAAERMKAENR